MFLLKKKEKLKIITYLEILILVTSVEFNLHQKLDYLYTLE